MLMLVDGCLYSQIFWLILMGKSINALVLQFFHSTFDYSDSTSMQQPIYEARLYMYQSKVDIFSPAYRRTLETGVSVSDDDDGPYSLSYPSNCLVSQTFILEKVER